MVNGEKVINDMNSISSLFSNYNSTVNGLSSSWSGLSFTKLAREAGQFSEEYYSSLKKQMEAFASACKLYKIYDVAKKNQKIAENNYKEALSRKDNSKAEEFKYQENNFIEEANDLARKIETELLTASSIKLDAVNYYGAEVIMKPSETTSSNSTTTSTTTNTNPPKITNDELDMDNYPRGNSKEDGMKRAILVTKYLMKYGGFTAEQAAAMAGVFLDENNCDPSSVMQAEKEGRGAKGTGGNGYGAGIGSWTFEETKKQVLKDAGFPENMKIEDLSLQQQCDMIIAVSNKRFKKFYNALKRCTNIEDASATAYMITGGVGHSKNWDTHPTQEEARNLADRYGRSNDARFGKSSYHWNSYDRRLELSKTILSML